MTINVPVKTDNSQFKDQLSALLFEYEELVNHIGPIIEQKYISLFGFLEIEVYRLEIELNKIKKKVQMIQSKMNHGEDLNMKEINSQLEILFEQYEENLKAQQEEFKNSINGEKVILTAEETAELKSNFRRIIKALHPDLNDDISDHEKTLFNQATIAFKSGDIETIRMIYSIIDDDDIERELDESYYQERVDKIKEKIAKYKEEYPYNKIGLLEDKSAIEEYTNYLKDIISRFKEEIEYYETRVEEMELESE